MNEFNWAKRVKNLEGQKMFQILERTKVLERQGKNILHFEIGDPEFDSPRVAIEAIKEALDINMTKYAPSSGISIYKDACQEMTEKSRGFKPTHKQLLVTSGANIQIYLACSCLIDSEDEVIIQDPAFVSYESIINLLGGKAVKIKLKEENNFEIDPEKIRNKVTDRTKAIIINSPHNPTGAVISKEVMEEIYRICTKNNIYLISDEVYGRMVYSDSGNEFFSPAEIDFCKEKTILIHSLSKTYSMTGWRIGAVTGPEHLINKMSLVFETINSCVPPFVQYAAAKLLKEDPLASRKMMKEYETRRNLFLTEVEKIKTMTCRKPNGAFYGFVNIQDNKYRLNSIEYSEYLLNNLNIAVCPGSFFGDAGEGYVRFCFANTEKNIRTAFERIRMDGI